MDRPEGLSNHMWNVCLGTWNFDPAKRPPFYKLRKQLEEIVEAGLDDNAPDISGRSTTKQPFHSKFQSSLQHSLGL